MMTGQFAEHYSELRLDAFGMSEAGHGRAKNEDAFTIDDIGRGKLIAVADGFSVPYGVESGRLAVDAIRESLGFTSGWSIADRLAAAVALADRKIRTHFDADHTEATGTTLTAAYVLDGLAYISHVGNTRAYLVRGQHVSQLTADQTYADSLRRSGGFSFFSTDMATPHGRGDDHSPDPVTMTLPLMPDDYLLVCSDGFSNRAGAAEITRAIEASRDVTGAVRRLIDLADSKHAKDNVTVVLAHVCLAATASRDFPSFWASVPARAMAA